MKSLWYGGDYSPEQWPREIWHDDIRLMRRAGVTVATVGVFAWSNLEPQPGQFNFTWLDEVLDLLDGAGVRVDLATATASPPPWLTKLHPSVLPVTAEGVTLSGGSRQHYNPSSAVYRRYAARLVEKIAERYHAHPALEAWHANNEFACHVHRDYSADSAEAFRVWLENRYGTIQRLNDAWGTAFWSQIYASFEEIEPPRVAPTFRNPTQLLDFDRFSSDAWLECLRMETAILRKYSPQIPITTNFMGFFKPLNYWRWSKEVDFVSDDHYPEPGDPAGPAFAAMTRDLIRSLAGGRPWILMEQSPSAVTTRPRNAAKPPGMHRLLSLQSVARGADGVMQFQWRQSKAGAEKFLTGMLPHAGERSRVFRETVALGEELASLAHVVGTILQASVAIVFDWESWWALEQGAAPAQQRYLDIVFRWYRELLRRGIMIDFVQPEATLTNYTLVLAPATMVLSEKAQTSLASFVDDGGHLVVSYQTGILTPDLHALLDGYLGELQRTLGLRIEEFAPPAGGSRSGTPVPNLQIDGLGAGTAREWGEVIEVSTAETRSRFVGGMLDGAPAITRNTSGSGSAWYVATAPDDLTAVLAAVLDDAGIDAPILPDRVEVVTRGTSIFVLNHSDQPVTLSVAGSAVVVGAMDAAVLPRLVD